MLTSNFSSFKDEGLRQGQDPDSNNGASKAIPGAHSITVSPEYSISQDQLSTDTFSSLSTSSSPITFDKEQRPSITSYSKSSTSTNIPRALVGLLIGTKIFKSLVIYLLATLLSSISSSSIYVSTENHNHKNIKLSPTIEEAFVTNIHSPPVALFGRWTSTVQLLTYIQLSSGILLLILQRLLLASAKPGSSFLSPILLFSGLTTTKEPLSGNTIHESAQHHRIDFLRIILHSIVSSTLLVIWISALQLCGPFRTIFIGTHYQYTIAGLLSSFLLLKSGAKLRGTVLFGFGVGLLLVFDKTSSTELVTPSNSYDGENAEEHNSFFSKSSVGIFLILTWLLMKYCFSAISQKYTSDLGVSIKLHTASTITSGVGLLLMTFVDVLDGADMIAFNFNTVMLTAIVSLGFTLDYFVDIICTSKIDPAKIARIGTISHLLSAFAVSFLGIGTTNSDVHSLTTIGAFVLIYFATLNLTSPERVAGPGSFVGYSSEGLPLYNFPKQYNSNEKVKSYLQSLLWNVVYCIRSLLKEVHTDHSSRRILYLWTIHAIIIIIDVYYGYSTNGFAMIADGIFKLFQLMVLSISIHSTIVSKWKPTNVYPFGYGRTNVVYGFVAALILLVVSSGLILNAVKMLTLSTMSFNILHVSKNELIESRNVLSITVILLLLNLSGVYFIKLCPFDRCHLYHSTIETRRGITGLLVSCTFRNVIILIVYQLIQVYHWLFLDLICSVFISILSIYTVFPILKNNVQILLLTTPNGLEKNIQHILLQILTMDGIISYKNHRFWIHSPTVYIGSIHIQATAEANEQQIIRQVNNLFISIGFTYFTTQLQKDHFIS